MIKLTKTQDKALRTATHGAVEVLPRNAQGDLDYSAPRAVVTGLIITGHRNAMFALRQRGLVRRDTAGADNVGLLTADGEAAFRALV